MKETKKTKKKKVKHATPLKRKVEAGVERKAWGRWVVLAILLGAGTFFSIEYRVVDTVKQSVASFNKPITKLVIEGNLQVYQKEDIVEMIRKSYEGSHKAATAGEILFFDVDLQAMRHDLDEQPWVYSATVGRQWPDALLVSIVEEKAIARWSNEGFINQYGDLIETSQVDNLNHLPVLNGNKQNSEEVAKTYLAASQSLSKIGIGIVEMSISENSAIEISTTEGFNVLLGQGLQLEKIRNFIFVFESYLAAKKREIKQVDLRYEQGLAVQWKADEQEYLLTELN